MGYVVEDDWDGLCVLWLMYCRLTYRPTWIENCLIKLPRHQTEQIFYIDISSF